MTILRKDDIRPTAVAFVSANKFADGSNSCSQWPVVGSAGEVVYRAAAENEPPHVLRRN